MICPTALPPGLLAAFDGARLEAKLELAALLATSDVDGWSHLACLGPGELLLLEPLRLRVGLWPASTTAANLRRSGQATLHVLDGGDICELRATAVERGVFAAMAVFDGAVSAIVRHAAPYARVSSLLTYRLTDPDAALQRWSNQIAAMRTLA